MSEKKERKLSKAELKRKEEFEKLTEKLTAEGYKPNHITLSALAGNVFGLLIAIPFIIPFVLLYFALGKEFSLDIMGFWIAYVIFLASIVVHELIHGITWAFFAENGWKSISFGIIMEYLTPYCSCNQPMKKKQIIIGALMPTIILGFLLGIIAIFTGSSIVFFVAMMSILGGGGDLLMTLKLLMYKSPSKDVLFIDHPYELGTAVFEKV